MEVENWAAGDTTLSPGLSREFVYTNRFSVETGL